MDEIITKKIPDYPLSDLVYRIVPATANPNFYAARVNRNIPWILPEEQDMLRNMVVCIAGCGGMGGLLASIFMRLGIGEIRLADCEEFEVSNLNRQLGAFMHTLGKSKAVETARFIRAIADDTTVVVYPQGITHETAKSFVEGAHVVCDEIEFWAIGSRYILHIAMRESDSVLFNAPTVGHRTYVTKFTPASATIEEAIGLTLAQANMLQEKIQTRTADATDVSVLMHALLPFVAPELPEYSSDVSLYSSYEQCTKRLLVEQTAPIIATNPPMAAGFLANQVLFHLLQRAGLVKRNFKLVPDMYGYHMFDAAQMASKIHSGNWITSLRKTMQT